MDCRFSPLFIMSHVDISLRARTGCGDKSASRHDGLGSWGSR